MAILPGATNFMNQLIFHPCSRPFYAYVITFAPAFVEAFLTTRVLDMEDIFRDKARDFAKAGSRATRRSLRHTRKPLFHADGGKANRISQRALVTALKWSQPLENIGYKLLVIGAADQLFYRWTSLLETFTHCNAPFSTGPFSRSRNPGRVSILPGGAAIGLPILEQDRGGWGSNSFSLGTPAGIYVFAFNLTVTAGSSALNGVSLRVTHQGAIGFQSTSSDPINIAAGETADLIVTGWVFTGQAGGIGWSWALVGPAVPIGLADGGGNMWVARREL